MPRLTKEQIKELWMHLSADEISVLHHISKPGASVNTVAVAVFAYKEGRTGETNAEYLRRLEIGTDKVQRTIRTLREKLGDDPGAVYRAFWSEHKKGRTRGKAPLKAEVPISEDFLDDIDMEDIRQKLRSLNAGLKKAAYTYGQKKGNGRVSVSSWRPQKAFMLMVKLGISHLTINEQSVVVQRAVEAELASVRA